MRVAKRNFWELEAHRHRWVCPDRKWWQLRGPKKVEPDTKCCPYCGREWLLIGQRTWLTKYVSN